MHAAQHAVSDIVFVTPVYVKHQTGFISSSTCPTLSFPINLSHQHLKLMLPVETDSMHISLHPSMMLQRQNMPMCPLIQAVVAITLKCLALPTGYQQHHLFVAFPKQLCACKLKQLSSITLVHNAEFQQTCHAKCWKQPHVCTRKRL